MAAAFDYMQDFARINFREQPHLYRIGKGEQGVLMIEPYKSEILPHWRFKNPEVAQESSEKIYELFLEYLNKHDFPGADMARKFLQMGYTRARRYANHRSGRKYSKNPQKQPTMEAEKKARKENLLPFDNDPVKAAAAEIFKVRWYLAQSNAEYVRQMTEHREKNEKEVESTTTTGKAFFDTYRTGKNT